MDRPAFIRKHLAGPWEKATYSDAYYVNIKRAGHCCNVSVKEHDEHRGYWTYRLEFDRTGEPIYSSHRYSGIKAAQSVAVEAAADIFKSLESEVTAELADDVALCETCGNEMLSDDDNASGGTCGRCRYQWDRIDSAD